MEGEIGQRGLGVRGPCLGRSVFGGGSRRSYTIPQGTERTS